MSIQYHAWKDIPILPQKRPVSLSESFAFHELNIERASSFQRTPIQTQTQTQTQTQIQIQTPNPTSTLERTIVHHLLRCTFHILLISIFETLFFFQYVSALEDNGLVGTFRSLSSGLVDACTNLTIAEREDMNILFAQLYNSTHILQNGENAYAYRSNTNHALWVRSWIYVASIFAVFVGLVLYTKIRSHSIQWKALVLENCGFVCILSMYEYMFFKTIVFSFSPISSQEIVRNTVQDIQQSCGILYF